MAREIYPGATAALSKTAKYKKITKPLLERKRRARINRCLDELKDLMVGALEIDDENMSKLEKADILELTVNHLTKLHQHKNPIVEAKKFQAGFGQCAAEACKFILSVPELDSQVSKCLVEHLSKLINVEPLSIQLPERQTFSPPISPRETYQHYSDHDRTSPHSEASQGIYTINCTPSANDIMSPITGLLTTVDKINHEPIKNESRLESKDAILQKIRQHIMDKRIHESNERQNRISVIREPELEAKCETLDLRKVRSPLKRNSDCQSTVKTDQTDDKTKDNELSEVSNVTSVVGRVELPMDYSNLPPKKKRKLIEYQEMLKMQMEREQFVEAEGNERGSDYDPAWRPW